MRAIGTVRFRKHALPSSDLEQMRVVIVQVVIKGYFVNTAVALPADASKS